MAMRRSRGGASSVSQVNEGNSGCAAVLSLARLKIHLDAKMHAFFLSLLLFAQASDVATHFAQAVEWQRRGDFERAVAEYRTVLRLAPDYAEAHANLGAALARLGRYDEAIASYQRALELSPELTPVWLNMGIAFYRMGQAERAAHALRAYFAAFPESKQARRLLGAVLVELGRDAEAIALLRDALDDAERDVVTLYSLGLALLRSGQPEHERVVHLLEQSAQGKPVALLLVGQAALAAGDYKGAVERLRAAAALDPALPRLDYSLGLALLMLGQHEDAIACFERERKRLPQDFWTLYYLAVLYDATGRRSAARSSVEAALRINPASAEANALLGKLLFKEGDARAALAPLEKATAALPRDAETRYILARVYKRLGRDRDAAREFAEAQRLKAQQVERERTRPVAFPR